MTQRSLAALLPTSNIQDPHARAFCERLRQNWEQLAAGPTAVVTADRLATSVAEQVATVIAGSAGSVSTGAPGGNPGVMAAIDTLQQSIEQSILYGALAQQTPSFTDLAAVRALADKAGQLAASGISNETSVRNTKDLALASAINRVWALVGGSSAVIADGSLASATPTTATATKWNNVIAAVTDPSTGNVASAAILQESRTYAASNDTTLNALYSVRAQIASGGQTVVGGFGFAATAGAGSTQGATFDFGVLANKFFIAAPSSGYNPATAYTATDGCPFIVVTTNTTIDGKLFTPGVYMKKAFIGTLTADSVTSGTLTSVDLSVTGTGRFRGTYAGLQANAAVYANESDSAVTGVFGRTSATLASKGATGAGVHGFAAGAESIGVTGVASGGIGMSGVTASSTNAGVRGNNTGSGPSLEAVTWLKTGGDAVIGGSAQVASSLTVGAVVSALKVSAVAQAGSSSNAVEATVDYSGGSGGSGVALLAISKSDLGTAHAIVGTWNKFGTSAVPARGTNNGAYASGIVGATNGNAFYANAGAVGPFTGNHEVAIPIGMAYTPGDIVVDDACLLRNGLSNTFFSVQLSAAPNQPGAIGVITYACGPLNRATLLAACPGELTADPDTGISVGPPEFEAIKDGYTIAQVNALGEGQINVCGEGGNIARGDLIVASSMPGKGMRQGDDLVRSYTVAKAREAVNFANPGEVQQVACIYLCG